MESYSLAKTKSTLESDDACGGGGHRRFASSNQNDSGICLSYGPNGIYAVDSKQTSVDGIHVSLLDQLNKLSIFEKDQKRALATGFETDFLPEGLSHVERSTICHPFGTQDMRACDPYRRLMSPVADPFQQDEDGDTQLHLAIIEPNLSVAIRLIELAQFTDQLDVQNDHHQTPLHLAVITDKPGLVRALVLSGASLTARDKHGNSALHLACKFGHAQCVERLTAPPNAEEEKYIWQERQKKRLETRQINIMRSNDYKLLNYEGDSCLHLALSSVSNSRYEILDYLLNTCGADINVQEGKCGFTLLHFAVKARDLFAAQFLLSNPSIAVNQCCYNGYTPLDFALTQKHNELANLLLGRGAVSFAMMANPDADAHQDVDFDDLIIAGKFPVSGSFFR